MSQAAAATPQPSTAPASSPQEQEPEEPEAAEKEEEEEEETCAICLETLIPSEQQRLSCGHSDFHNVCIEKWFLTSAPRGNCPKCREVVRDFPSSLRALLEAQDVDGDVIGAELLRDLVLLVVLRYLVETELGVD